MEASFLPLVRVKPPRDYVVGEAPVWGAATLISPELAVTRRDAIPWARWTSDSPSACRVDFPAVGSQYLIDVESGSVDEFEIDATIYFYEPDRDLAVIHLSHRLEVPGLPAASEWVLTDSPLPEARWETLYFGTGATPIRGSGVVLGNIPIPYTVADSVNELIMLSIDESPSPALVGSPVIVNGKLAAVIWDRTSQIEASPPVSDSEALLAMPINPIRQFIDRMGAELFFKAFDSTKAGETQVQHLEESTGSAKAVETDVHDSEQSTVRDPDSTSAPVDSSDLDLKEFFRRLNNASRRALSHAAGMSRMYTISAPSTIESSQTESIEPPAGIPIRLEFIVAGLFENESGPTRRLLLSKNIDDAKFADLFTYATGYPLSREYTPVKPDQLPLDFYAWSALFAALNVADRMGSAQINSRYLLYGALSMSDRPLIKELAEAGVRKEDVPLDGKSSPVPSSIAFVTADTSDGEDLLGFEADVSALSAIIAAKDVAPPLSIGLFGDWGSGKSFFMGKVDQQIRKLTGISRAVGGKSAYHSNIVQIWFNAWSYVETDLWASLVTDIFEELARAIEEDSELARGTNPATAKARLLAAMASARDVVAEQERRRDAAKAELEAVEQHIASLKDTDRELQEKLGTKALLKDAYRAVVKQPQIKAKLDEAAEQLNVPEAERAATELQASLLEIKNIWSALRLALRGWKSWKALVLAGVLLTVLAFLWVLVPRALETDLALTIARVSAAVLAALAWLAPFLKKAAAALSIVSEVQEQQKRRIQQERTRIEADSRRQQEQVRQRLTEAEQHVDNARAEISRLDQTLKEMRADRQLLDFIRERSASTDYTSRLGTVARARRDFRQLSDLMERVTKEETQAESASRADGQPVELMLPRIDRIVLYIDDLDRCAEDRVVKVLEAVHLLLAFKLFVVIVAVDSRWLLRSLRQHSAAFQNSNDGAIGISDEELAHWESTPLNYLEKIFQIPFYLRPMRGVGFGRLVDSVVGEVAPEQQEQPGLRGDTPAAAGESAARVQVDVAPESGEDRTTTQPTAETGGAIQAGQTAPSGEAVPVQATGVIQPAVADALEQVRPASGSISPPSTDKPLPEETNPAALQLREWERDFMKKLHPLINSPRSAKRFINIYRLLRVSIVDQAELDAFVGDKNGGHHRAALLLLAILTGYPAEATDILRDLLEEERTENWWQYVDNLEARWCGPDHASTGAGTLVTQRRRDLMDKLRLLRGEIPLSQSCDQFAKWASRVARYSFESGRVLTLMSEQTDTD